MFKILYYYIENQFTSVMRGLIGLTSKIDYKDIPIYINNFNRLSCLRMLIDRLELLGYRNIYIIDNHSSYQPLLSYYANECPYKIIKLDKNLGHLALWKSKIYYSLINKYYIYTDPDVLPSIDIPENFVEIIIRKMKSNNKIYKIGLSLIIDDLPDSYIKKNDVIAWESRWWLNKVDEMYRAHVDTTFAIYAPWSWGGSNDRREMYRMDKPFSAHHLPWYEDSNVMTEENQFYKNSIRTKTHWTEL